MGDLVNQKYERGLGHVVIKQEKMDYRSPPLSRRHNQHSARQVKYPDVRVAPCFRPSGILAADLPVEKHFVDKSMGLRHFSTKVCEKVKEKGRTNYNQVADELVAEYFAANNMNSEEFLERQKFDQKNIRRRVYDALNVLLAMNIICKRKKDIDWVGLPATKAGEIKRLEEEKAKLTERIRRKKENIQELIVQLVAYKSLVWKNREMERVSARPPENTILYLPFVIINTSKNTTVDCAVSGDRSEFLFNFDQSFEVHDDFEALKRLGYSYGLEHNALNPEMMEHIDEFIPPALRGYIPRILGGEMSDCDSRNVRSSAPMQYIIHDGPSGDKLHTSSYDASSSEHSADGSYADLSQQSVYTMPDNMSYSAYESEIGDDVEIVDSSAHYPAYLLPSGSTGYPEQGHRTVSLRHTNPAPRTTVANMPEYSEVGPSTSKAQPCLPRVVNVKRPVYAVPANQVFRKAQVEADGTVVYTHNIQPKRSKTEDYNV
ncbi:Transcription factor [Trichostrongylus colubriformis]|uniref:Transcription factor n=1 Tax=Trichostrongylus colubriformis TaxID=6319 RepID=A0AAN8IDX3_TRICO